MRCARCTLADSIVFVWFVIADVCESLRPFSDGDLLYTIHSDLYIYICGYNAMDYIAIAIPNAF